MIGDKNWPDYIIPLFTLKKTSKSTKKYKDYSHPLHKRFSHIKLRDKNVITRTE